MRKFAFLLAAMAGILSATVSAEAQRSHFQSAGQDWVAARFSSEAYPQSRSPRASSRSYRGEQSAGRASRSVRASNRTSRSQRTSRRARGGEGGSSFMASLTGGSGIGPRPRQWCGWWMRTQLGGGPAFNLAWNWRHYGSPTTPQVGAVVVWRHHVGMITGHAGNGKWIVKSGNDGGAVRERARSVSGAVFRI